MFPPFFKDREHLARAAEKAEEQEARLAWQTEQDRARTAEEQETRLAQWRLQDKARTAQLRGEILYLSNGENKTEQSSLSSSSISPHCRPCPVDLVVTLVQRSSLSPSSSSPWCISLWWVAVSVFMCLLSHPLYHWLYSNMVVRVGILQVL